MLLKNFYLENIFDDLEYIEKLSDGPRMALKNSLSTGGDIIFKIPQNWVTFLPSIKISHRLASSFHKLPQKCNKYISSMEIATPSIKRRQSSLESCQNSLKIIINNKLRPLRDSHHHCTWKVSTTRRKTNMMIIIFLLMRYLDVRLLRF